MVLHGFGLNFQVFVDQSENNLRCKYECIFRSKLLFFCFLLGIWFTATAGTTLLATGIQLAGDK